MQTILQTQQQLAHHALNAFELAAQKLRPASEVVDLPETPMDLMAFYLENPIRHCEQMSTAGLQTKIEMMARFNHWLIGNAKERMGKAWAIFRKRCQQAQKQ